MLTDQQGSRLYVIRHSRSQTEDERFLISIIDALSEGSARELAGEIDARHKLELALSGKDRAMGVLFDRLGKAGIDCSDLIP
jgi:hypothetical protein